MRCKTLKTATMVAALCGGASLASAEPVTYEIDPSHTYPAFEADHLKGLSIWRGKIASTSGTVVYDKEAEAGTVTVEMDMTSIDFSHEGMNTSARENILNVAEFPSATYTGTLADFVDGSPTRVDGQLTMHGVTQDVDLDINQFRCQKHYRYERETCGADASTTIDWADYGIDFAVGRHWSEVKLLITVEANSPDFE